MSKYSEKAPDRSAAGRAEVHLPTKCEVRGCQTRWVPRDPYDPKIEGYFMVGRADVFVDGNFGEKRGVCADHYTRKLVRDGRASNQDIVDEHGRMDHAKISQLQASKQEPLAIQPPRHNQPKGPKPFELPPVIADRLEHLDDEANDGPPDWFLDRPA